MLFVAKKNVKALEEILDALLSDNQDLLDEEGRLNASILLIDDEADNAFLSDAEDSCVPKTFKVKR